MYLLALNYIIYNYGLVYARTLCQSSMLYIRNSQCSSNEWVLHIDNISFEFVIDGSWKYQMIGSNLDYYAHNYFETEKIVAIWGTSA